MPFGRERKSRSAEFRNKKGKGEGAKRVHNGDEIMAAIVAKRVVEHLERSGFMVMRKPAAIGAAPMEDRDGGRRGVKAQLAFHGLPSS
jgi:hypothetical protein